jgi:hypothetical protein
MKALTFLRSLGASQPSVVHPRLVRLRRLHTRAVHRAVQWRGAVTQDAVLANGLVAFLGRGRPQPAITAQQVFACEAFAAQVAGTVSKGGM